MKGIGKFAVAALLSLTSIGCGSIIDRIAPDAVRDAKSHYEELRERKADQILQSFDPIGDKVALRRDLEKVIALVPEEDQFSVETLGASVECKTSGICTKFVVLEYRYSDRWILFQITTNNRSGNYAITNIQVDPESTPHASMSRFSLRGKGVDHYMVMILALLSLSFAIYALVLSIRTPIRKRKWLWIIVTILGIGKLGIEWTNGALWYKVAYLAIVPAGCGFDSVSPFVYTSIPAGGILFLLLRKRLTITPPVVSPASETEPQAEADLIRPNSAE